MVRNRNGYWMSPKFMMSAADDGAGDGIGTQAGGGSTSAPAGDAGTGNGNAPAGNDSANDGSGGDGKSAEDSQKSLAAQLEQLRADMARQKEALDKATKEAAGYKRELRSRQTQEEIDAATKREAEEKREQEFAELQRKVARAESTKSVMSKLGLDEESAGKIAECLTGCEDIENALLMIQKAWSAKEKALKLEYGKIPGPGAGGSNEEDAEEKAAIEIAKALGRDRASVNKSVADGLKGYMR